MLAQETCAAVAMLLNTESGMSYAIPEIAAIPAAKAAPKPEPQAKLLAPTPPAPPAPSTPAITVKVPDRALYKPGRAAGNDVSGSLKPASVSASMRASGGASVSSDDAVSKMPLVKQPERVTSHGAPVVNVVLRPDAAPAAATGVHSTPVIVLAPRPSAVATKQNQSQLETAAPKFEITLATDGKVVGAAAPSVAMPGRGRGYRRR